MTPGPVIRVSGLCARRGQRSVLDGVSFEVAAGEIVGLLGPNGAGKTTTLAVLATLIAPASGVVEIAGRRIDRDPAAVRAAIGYVPQALAIYPSLTARENVVFFARLSGARGRQARAAAARALTLVGLDARADDRAETYSGGMQRRLNLACALFGEPAALLLDEPTVGVDPQSRERVFAAVRAQAERGAAVLYSTHYMEEAERLCDRVVLVDDGRVVASGTPGALIRSIGAGLELEVVTVQPLPAGWLDGLDGARAAVLAAEHDGAGRGGVPLSRGCTVRVRIAELALAPRVLERAAIAGGEVLELHVAQPDLQDVFLALTGRELRD
jgi:ABC-2 type transport system ATP-binding protein